MEEGGRSGSGHTGRDASGRVARVGRMEGGGRSEEGGGRREEGGGSDPRRSDRGSRRSDPLRSGSRMRKGKSLRVVGRLAPWRKECLGYEPARNNLP